MLAPVLTHALYDALALFYVLKTNASVRST
jgi:hypothetical protein